jgi:acetyl esterase/lipase
LARNGLVAISVEYRVKKQHGSSPFESKEDALDALLWVYDHAKQMGIDRDHIAVGGGSAGGHLAAMTVMGTDCPTARIPVAVVLFNPVLDCGPEGFGMNIFGELKTRYPEISPMHLPVEGLPPFLIMTGSEDKIIPPARANAFKRRIEEAGGICRVAVYPGAGHGFFNAGRNPENDLNISRNV